MPQCTITISDEQDTEYQLLVDYDVTPADPEVGLMSPIGEPTDFECTQVAYNVGGERKEIDPASMGDGMGKWLGKWCWEMFEKQINDRMADVEVEDDYPEYE